MIDKYNNDLNIYLVLRKYFRKSLQVFLNAINIRGLILNKYKSQLLLSAIELLDQNENFNEATLQNAGC